MKKIYLLLSILVSVECASAQFTFQNVNLLSDFDDLSVTPEPTYGIRYQSCWGWADTVAHREYGIIGSSSGTFIVEVTDPLNPVQRDYVPAPHGNLIWHEYKTYQNYLYIISDDPTPNRFQICDLSYLPDSVHVVFDSNSLFSRAHTIYIEGNKMYLASVTASSYKSMQVYSLANPVAPVLLRSLSQDYPAISQVHDMFVTHDTVYASCANQGLFIFKYDSIANTFSEIGTLTSYPDQGYNHSSVLSKDHTTLYMCDEVPAGLGTKVVDVTTISTATVDTVFYTNPGDTPHNPYVRDNFLYLAAYNDGVYIYDITTPAVPVLAGFFDTHPQNGTIYPDAYAGCWAVYTDLPSGTLLAADMQMGLFCLDVSQITTGINRPANLNESMMVYPNPAYSSFKVKLNLKADASYTFELLNALGSTVKKVIDKNSLSEEIQIPVNTLPAGIYFAKLITDHKTFVQKINIEK
jgi:choice-of-anchor B domain-containing protein